MSTTGADDSLTYERVREPTLVSAWQEATGTGITDRLLEWPPDVLALVNIVLTRAEAFRFALSAPDRWPPGRYPDWARSVVGAARGWSAWAEEQTGEVPGLLTDEWDRLLEGAETPLEELAAGGHGRLCEALLTLHAIADEACAGVGIALDTSHPEGGVYRGRGRELLTRTGSMARIDPRRLRVLPKVCTPPTGRPSFSR